MSDDKIKLGSGGAKSKTKLYLIGPPASGKSTIANTIADLAGAYLLDSDYAKRKLPEYDNQIGAASDVPIEKKPVLLENTGIQELNELLGR